MTVRLTTCGINGCTANHTPVYTKRATSREARVPLGAGLGFRERSDTDSRQGVSSSRRRVPPVVAPASSGMGGG